MRIAFRTRGNHKQGMGDVMSSLALADAFRDHGHEILFVVDDDPEAVDCVSQCNYSVKPVQTQEKEFSYLESFKPDVIIVNQLNNPKIFLNELKKCTDLLVTVDDAGPGASIADIRFNPEYYSPDSYCGPEFVPLRKEFQDMNKKEKNINKEVKTILVTLGGSDTYGFTPKVVCALSCISDEIDITVITGSAFRHIAQLNEAIESARRPFLIRRDVGNMAELMFSSDFAVCGGGITLFELACVGTPAVIVCCEPFEEETATRMQEDGFGINLGFGEGLDEESIFKAIDTLIKDYYLRLEMSRKGKELVDGKGAKRMAEIILGKIKG